MDTDTIFDDASKKFQYRFSLCCIVTDPAQYDAMRSSFELNGFTNDCEYLVADNSKGNQYDAYTAINNFLQNCRGEFALIVHQDVRCIDRMDVLKAELNNLDKKDGRWAVCGNAGGVAYHEIVYYLKDVNTVRKSKGLPARVHSLDENLLIVNRKTPVHLSAGLKGFHLYGTDICLVAGALGYHSYVIPFMVQHLSAGNLKDLDSFIPVFLENYGHTAVNRFIQTTCTGFYLSNSAAKNKLYNSPMLLPIIKLWQRMRKIF
jgi:hypothetical protein